MAKSASKTEPIPDDIKAMSFEKAIAELEAIVGQLEAGRVGLEESIDIYTRGEALRRHCEEKLKNAEDKLAKVMTDADGNAVSLAPVDMD